MMAELSRTVRLTLILALLVLPFVSAGSYLVDSDGRAYIDDSRVRFTAPLVVGGPRPVIEGVLESKQFSGGVNLFWGFNNDEFVPRAGSVTLSEVATTEYVCAPPKQYIVSDGVVTCYTDNPNGTTTTHFEIAYDRVNAQTYTAYVDHVAETTTPANSLLRFDNINHNDNDVYYLLENAEIAPGLPIKWRLRGEIPIGASAKYDVGFYPSSYGVTRNAILQAINDGVFYYLDPFINTTHYEAGTLTNTSNPWTNDDDETLTTAQVNTGTVTYAAGHAVNQFTHAYLLQTDGTDVNASRSLTSSTGSPTYTTGKFGNGVTGDGNDGVARTNAAAIEGTGAFSVSIWTKVDGSLTVNQAAWSNYYTSGGNGWNGNIGPYLQLLGTYQIGISYYDGASRAVESGVVPTIGQWYHVVWTYDGTNAHKLYVDGVLKKTYADAIGTVARSGSSSVAVLTDYQNGYYSFLNGSVDSVYIYNYALADGGCSVNGSACGGEISELYNAVGEYNDYDTTGNLYRSSNFSIGINASTFDALYTTGGTGSVGLNVTCNADDGSPSWTGNVASGSKGVSCPVEGDKLAYEISLSGGDSSNTPIAYNLTLDFYEASNTPPVLSNLVVLPNATTPPIQDKTAGVIYTDADGDNGTVFFYWFVNGVNVLNDTDAVASGANATSILDTPTYFGLGDTVNVTVNATDGTDFSNTLRSGEIEIPNQANVTFSAITFSPSAPDENDDIAASVTTDDVDEHAYNVTATWLIGGSPVFSESFLNNVNSTLITSTLTANYTAAGDTVVVLFNATDGYNSTTTQNSVFVSAAATTTTTAADWVEIIIFAALFTVLVFAGYGAFKTGSLTLGALSFIFSIVLFDMVNSGLLAGFSGYADQLSVVFIILGAVVLGSLIGGGRE